MTKLDKEQIKERSFQETQELQSKIIAVIKEYVGDSAGVENKFKQIVVGRALNYLSIAFTESRLEFCDRALNDIVGKVEME